MGLVVSIFVMILIIIFAFISECLVTSKPKAVNHPPTAVFTIEMQNVHMNVHTSQQLSTDIRDDRLTTGQGINIGKKLSPYYID